MIVTIWCVAVILLSIFLVGTPLSWMLNKRNWSGEQAWLETPFLGIAAILLLLQNLIYFDLPLQYTAPLIWITGLAGWFWMYRARQLLAVIATIPRALFGMALAVYFLQGIGLFIIGAKYYVGRAWLDQYNYTVLAEFLVGNRFSLSMSEVGNRPYLVTAITLKDDRIGQSVLHGFFAVSSFQNIKTLFEPTILLGSALTVIAIYVLACRFRISKPFAVLTGGAAGLLPAISMVHLESFFSQALAIPILLIFPALLISLSEELTWRRLIVCSLISAALTSIYTEFWIILVGLTILILGIAALRTPSFMRQLTYCVVIILSPFIVNPLFIGSALKIFERIDAPLLPQNQLYPWALSIEGFMRLWLGDLVEGHSVPQPLLLIYALIATVLGYYGLFRISFGRLAIWHRIWGDPDKWRDTAFAFGLLALALLPAAVIVRDSAHAYQFYKLLLTISPLLVLGIGLVCQPHQADTPHKSTKHLLFSKTLSFKRLKAIDIRLLTRLMLICVLIAGAFGTISMALQSTSLQPKARYNGSVFIAPEMQQLQERLEALHDTNLFIYNPSNTPLLDVWLTYFARHNNIWLSKSMLNRIDLADNPETKPIVDASTLPSDLIILSHTATMDLMPNQIVLWSNKSYQLWRPAKSKEIIPLRIENENGIQVVNGQSFFWVGQKDTQIVVLVTKEGQLRMTATFNLGPSAPNLTTRHVRFTTDQGHQADVVFKGGLQSITVPVIAGINTITLHSLDQPSVAKLPNGDTRQLLLSVRGLQFKLDP